MLLRAKPKNERRVTTLVPVTAFLRTIRRRLVVRDVLVAAGAAVVINEICRWAWIAAFVAMKRVVPALDIGPIVLVILAAAAIRRWSPAAAARRVDARLGLSDRLTSFLDFAERDDVPGAVRDAQARETGRALAGVRPDSAAPIRVWLAAGPLLLAASLIYPYFLFNRTETTTMLLLRRIGTGSNHGDGQRPVAGIPNEGQPPAVAGESTGTPQPDAAGQPDRREDAVSQAKPEPGQVTAEKPVDGPEGEGPLPAPQDETADKRTPDHGNAVEPERLVSEQVGRALAKVVDPIYSPGKEQPQPTEATGSVSINLVPHSRPGRTGGVPGEGSMARRVTVDLDALPEEYRPLVKTYFELLAAGAPVAGEATTPPTRSEKP